MDISEVKDAEYKKVSVDRLTSRLALKKYDVSAPLTDSAPEVRRVKILLSQHIGAPAKAAVKRGDKVKCGDVIAVSDENVLGVNIHASIDGSVSEVSDKYIIIER